MATVGRTETKLAAFAVVVMIVARYGSGLGMIGYPWMVFAVGLGGAGVRLRRVGLIGVAVLIVVASRSTAQLHALSQQLPVGGQSGIARLVTDPTDGQFDVQVVIELGGRRYVASSTFANQGLLPELLAGQYVHVEGSVSPLQGAPRGWVLSNHLAGRFKITSVSPTSRVDPIYRQANDLRRRIERSSNGMDEDRRSLYLGLVIGDDRFQSELQQYRFKASGLTHLLAVSGQNVSFVLAIASPLLRRAGPRLSIAIALPLLCLFAVVTRAEPPVLRAVVMATIGLFALSADRESQAMSVLSLTVVVLVVIDPLIVHAVGFQLSVLATFGLIVLSQPLSERLPGPMWLRSAMSVTLAAQVATAPVILGFNDGIPAVATPANLIAVPAAGVVMMGGLTVGLFAGSIRADLGSLLMVPIGWLVDLIDWVAAVASRIPLAPLTPIRLLAMVLTITAWLTWRTGAQRRQKQRVDDSDGPQPSRWSLEGVIASILVVLVISGLVIPRRAGTGVEQISDAAVFANNNCNTSVLVLSKGAKGVQVLEALSGLHVRSIPLVVTDDSASARRAAAMVGKQHTIGSESHESSNDGVDPTQVARSVMQSC